MTTFYSDDVILSGSFSGSFIGNGSGLTGVTAAPPFIDNLITVGMAGSDTDYTSISESLNNITDASSTNTYTVEVGPGLYIENPMVVPSYVAVRGDTSISTIVSASNPNSPLFTLSDQSMIIDMQIQGVTGSGTTAVLYSSATTPQTNAISYVENVRFGTNYTHASVIGVPGGNCIMQCSNVKYGGYTDSSNKSFDIGFRVSGSGGGIGRMQLRNVTSTNGGITGSSDQIFALADAPGCTFIVNGCLLTKAVGSTIGTGFKVYNGGSLRLTAVNFQRWAKGIYAPDTGSGPSIYGSALNFENDTYDIVIEHPSASGHLDGADTFLKTVIPANAPLYEINQDPRKITVGKKGADFTSISASVAWITDSDINNRYVIEVGPGQFTEKEIDLTGRPYVSIVGSSIQTTQIFPSGSSQHLIKMGINNEVSFLSLTNAPVGYSALYIDDVGDYAQAHKLSFYDCDTCITVLSSTQDTKFYGEYLDFNGAYTYGTYVSSSNGFLALASLENYYQFPTGSTGLVANYGIGPNTELDLYTGAMVGEGANDVTSVAISLEEGADLQAAGFDFPGWDTAVNISSPIGNTTSSFNIVGSMIHDSLTFDFRINDPNAVCRFQGTADHSKISNSSNNFFWTFLDATDGELDITRNLAVTFANGQHTDASTLIFRGSPMGVMNGGQIITGSNGYNLNEVVVLAGFGYLEDTSNPGVYKRIDWTETNPLPLDDNTTNYIYVDLDNNIQKSNTEPDNIQNIILGRAVCADGKLLFIDQSPRNASHTTNLLSTFNRTALGPVFANGSIVTANGTNRLDINGGVYFFGENEFNPTGGTSITFQQYYQSSSALDGWNKTSTVDVPINTWDSGSNALVALSASYYSKHTLYLNGDGPEEKYFLVVSQQQFATLVEAEGANLATPPNYFIEGVVPLAAVYAQSGSGIVQIEDIRPIVGFRAGGVNAAADHGNLLGLAGDDHPQYLLADGTRAMSGPLTASIVSASSGITGSLFGTASYATTASYALTASYAPSNINISADTTSNNLSQIVFSNSNNVNFGLNGSTITANAPIAFSAGAASANLSSLVFSNSNGVSFGLNGSTLTATFAAGAANITVSAGTATNAVSSLVFGNGGNVSFGLNGSTITGTVASSLSNINISIDTVSNNLSQLVFSNANGVSFGLNSNTITATANGSGIQAADSAATNNISQLVFSNANNVSFGLNGSTVTATANAGGVTLSYFNPRDGYLQQTTQHGQGTLHLAPAQFPNVQFDRIVLPMFYSNASNSSNSLTVSMYWGLYTRNASSFSLLDSVSTSWNISNSGTLGSYSLYSGIRLLTMGFTDTITEGQYYVGILSRTTTSGGLGMTAAAMAASQIGSIFVGLVGQSHNTSQQYTRGLGYYSVSTSVLPTVVPISQINGSNSNAFRIPLYYALSGTF